MKIVPVAIVGVVAIVVVVVVVLFATGIFSGDGTPGDTPVAGVPTPDPNEVMVPINLKGAKNLGSIHIELVYDPTALEVVKFESGELSQNALSEANLEIPGRVIIGIVDTDGMDGDGAVAMLSFRGLNGGGDIVLTLENVATHDATSLIDVPSTAADGSFNAGDRSFTAPTLNFGP